MIEHEKPKYRHEYKYICNSAENAVLKIRAQGLLKPDPHTDVNGAYRIRSLYFDTPEDDCYFENLCGSDLRDKYRIRFYNHDSSHLVLEKKSKIRQMTLKESCVINSDIYEDLVHRRNIRVKSDMSPMLQKLLLEMMQRSMRPVVIVDYLRYPFIEKTGNVRVTFDEAISSSNDIERFRDTNPPLRPVLPSGQSVLEIKWDELLPDYIMKHLQTDNLQWSSFSKYSLCRQYNTYGGLRI